MVDVGCDFKIVDRKVLCVFVNSCRICSCSARKPFKSEPGRDTTPVWGRYPDLFPPIALSMPGKQAKATC